MNSSPSKSDLFKGRHFEQEIIVLCVRWYLRYKLSYRDLLGIIAERGLSISHTTILRWVQRYAPEFDKRWNRFSAPAGTSWRVDEAYVRIAADGLISTGLSMLPARPSTSGSARDATSPHQRRSFAKPCVHRASLPKLSLWTVTLPPTGPSVNFNSRDGLLT